MIFKIKTGFFLLVLVATLSMLACVSGGEIKKSKPGASQTSSKMVIKRGMKFAWGDRVFFDAPRFGGAVIEKELDSAIADGLAAKGLRYSNYVESSDLVFHYTVFLGRDFSKREAEEVQTIKSNLSEDTLENSSFEEGKIHLLLRDVATEALVWEKEASGFTDTNMSDDLRKQRMFKLIEILLDDIDATVD